MVQIIAVNVRILCLYITFHLSAVEHRASTRIFLLAILGISFDLHPGLLNSFGLFEHHSSQEMLSFISNTF